MKVDGFEEKGSYSQPIQYHAPNSMIETLVNRSRFKLYIKWYFFFFNVAIFLNTDTEGKLRKIYMAKRNIDGPKV